MNRLGGTDRMSNRRVFADRLNKLLYKADMTNRDLAKKLEYGEKSSNVISRWFSGKSEPKLNEIINISKLFNVSADYLLGLVPEDVITKNFDIKKTAVQLHLSEEAVNGFMNATDNELDNAMLQTVEAVAGRKPDNVYYFLNAINERYTAYLVNKQWEKLTDDKKEQYRKNIAKNIIEQGKYSEDDERYYLQVQKQYYDELSDLAELHISRYAVDLVDEIVKTMYSKENNTTPQPTKEK